MPKAPQPQARSVAINRLHYPVLTLGFRAARGSLVPGLLHPLPGCIVPDTWKAGPEHSVPVAALLQSLDRWLPKCDGVTISGGEPFDQPDALEELLLDLKRRCPIARPGSPIDLLVYSGYTFKTLQSRHPSILALADVIVAGPFVERLEDDRPFVGSPIKRSTSSPRWANNATGRLHFNAALPLITGMA